MGDCFRNLDVSFVDVNDVFATEWPTIFEELKSVPESFDDAFFEELKRVPESFKDAFFEKEGVSEGSKGTLEGVTVVFFETSRVSFVKKARADGFVKARSRAFSTSLVDRCITRGK